MRRPFWVALGVGFGAAGAILVSRWTRRQVQRAKPAAIARETRGGLLELSKLVAESVEEGKREKVLRVVQEAFGPAPAPAPPGGG